MANFLETLRVTFQPTSSLIWSIRLFAHILFLAPHLPCLSLSCLCLSLSCLCLVSVCVTFQPTSSLIWSVRLFAHILFLAPHIPCLCFVSVSVLSLSVSVLFLSVLPSSPHPLSFGQYGSSPTYCSWLCTFSVLSLSVSVFSLSLSCLCLSLSCFCLCYLPAYILSHLVSKALRPHTVPGFAPSLSLSCLCLSLSCFCLSLSCFCLSLSFLCLSLSCICVCLVAVVSVLFLSCLSVCLSLSLPVRLFMSLSACHSFLMPLCSSLFPDVYSMLFPPHLRTATPAVAYFLQVENKHLRKERTGFKKKQTNKTVSYTHLTLPTRR